MSKGKILIVEDEMIIAENLKAILEDLEYEVLAMAISAEEAIEFLEETDVDIALLDVVIQGKMDGIDLSKLIRNNYHIPYIFITAFTDKVTIERAKEANPYGYIVKPFKHQDINIAVEMALSNFQKSCALNLTTEKSATTLSKETTMESLFIRDKGLLLKIKFNEILWVAADGNYTLIHTKSSKYALRTCMRELEERLPQKHFIRVHKSYIINLEELTAINSQSLFIGKQEIPIGRSYYPILVTQLNIFTSR